MQTAADDGEEDQGVADVYGDVDQAVAEYVQAVYGVVECKGEPDERPAVEGGARRGLRIASQRGDLTDVSIFDNGRLVVEYEGVRKAVGIDA